MTNDAEKLSSDELRRTVLSLVAEAADLEEHEVGWEDTLVDDLGLDSLGIVGVFVDLAYDYGIEEPDRAEDWSAYDTPAKIYAYALERTDRAAQPKQ